MRSGSEQKTGEKLKILVLGYIVRGPVAGMAWHHLQYVMGLVLLGHDVYFMEDSGDEACCCYDPTRHLSSPDPSYGLAFAARAFAQVGLADRWAYHDAHTGTWNGPQAGRMPQLCREADLLLNLSCANPLRPWARKVPIRVLIDTDPCFTQIRNLTDPARRRLTGAHTMFFSFGENLGRAGCTVPDDGFAWQPTRQPVVLDAWPVMSPPAGARFTTIMQWQSYRRQEFGGRRYGLKSASFRPYRELPSDFPGRLELALGRGRRVAGSLRRAGWVVSDPLKISLALDDYRDYIRQSYGEFSVAKHGYVKSRCGWFSERSACYLASGRPVVVQETGFTDWLSTGAGVLAFDSPETACEQLARVETDWAAQSRAARAVAEEYFDSSRILTELLTRSMEGMP